MPAATEPHDIQPSYLSPMFIAFGALRTPHRVFRCHVAAAPASLSGSTGDAWLHPLWLGTELGGTAHALDGWHGQEVLGTPVANCVAATSYGSTLTGDAETLVHVFSFFN